MMLRPRQALLVERSLAALAQQRLGFIEPRSSDADVMVRSERSLDQTGQRRIVKAAPPCHLDGPFGHARRRLTETDR